MHGTRRPPARVSLATVTVLESLWIVSCSLFREMGKITPRLIKECWRYNYPRFPCFLSRVFSWFFPTWDFDALSVYFFVREPVSLIRSAQRHLARWSLPVPPFKIAKWGLSSPGNLTRDLKCAPLLSDVSRPRFWTFCDGLAFQLVNPASFHYNLPRLNAQAAFSL